MMAGRREGHKEREKIKGNGREIKWKGEKGMETI